MDTPLEGHLTVKKQMEWRKKEEQLNKLSS